MSAKKSIIAAAGFLCLLVGALPAAAADDEADAIAMVKRIQRAATENTMATLRDGFDAEATARTVLGTRWSGASDKDRRDFIELIEEVVPEALKQRLGGHDRKFSVLGSRRLSNGDILVSSRITQPNGHVLALGWRVARCGPASCIGDLIADGASLTVVRRDDVAARLGANGGSISDLIAALRKSPQRGP